jgi:hypothetical protein
VSAPDASVAALPDAGIGDVPAAVITGDSSTPSSGALARLGNFNGSQILADLLHIPERN